MNTLRELRLSYQSLASLSEGRNSDARSSSGSLCAASTGKGYGRHTSRHTSGQMSQRASTGAHARLSFAP